jgi:hypothetical protein
MNMILDPSELSSAIDRIRQFVSRIPEEHSDVLRSFIDDVMLCYGASIEDTDGEYSHTWSPLDKGTGLDFTHSNADKVFRWIDGSEDLPK